jgi:hypothetical protein
MDLHQIFVEERQEELDGWVKYWKRFDEFIMKPLLIRDYNSKAPVDKEKPLSFDN